MSDEHTYLIGTVTAVAMGAVSLAVHGVRLLDWWARRRI